jgi:hypothetical protein
MSDIKTDIEPDKDDQFLDFLEEGIKKIVLSRKSSTAEKIAAINAGHRVAAMRYKVAGGDPETGFFDK